MPIGKNALKRVSNNGYSNVKTAAPDMENSEIDIVKNEVKSASKKALPKKSEPKAKPTEKKAQPKSEEKKAAAKKASSEKPKTKKQSASVKENASHPDGFIRIGLGDDMPVYLL